MSERDSRSARERDVVRTPDGVEGEVLLVRDGWATVDVGDDKPRLRDFGVDDLTVVCSDREVVWTCDKCGSERWVNFLRTFVLCGCGTPMIEGRRA